MACSRITPFLMSALSDALTITSRAVFHVSLAVSKDKRAGRRGTVNYVLSNKFR